MWIHNPQELKAGSLRDIGIAMFIAALSTIATWWKQPRCPWTDRLTDKQNTMCVYTHTQSEMLFNLKMKKILSHTTTGMYFDYMTLSEISQLQKDKSCRIPLV